MRRIVQIPHNLILLIVLFWLLNVFTVASTLPGYRHAGRLLQFDAAGRLKVKPWLSMGAQEGAPMETSVRKEGDPAGGTQVFLRRHYLQSGGI